jgi:hypothetical protein
MEEFGSPAYYRARAADMRRLAAKASSDSTWRSYLLMAADWDRLASHAEAMRQAPKSEADGDNAERRGANIESSTVRIVPKIDSILPTGGAK